MTLLSQERAVSRTRTQCQVELQAPLTCQRKRPPTNRWKSDVLRNARGTLLSRAATAASIRWPLEKGSQPRGSVAQLLAASTGSRGAFKDAAGTKH